MYVVYTLRVKTPAMHTRDCDGYYYYNPAQNSKVTLATSLNSFLKSFLVPFLIKNFIYPITSGFVAPFTDYLRRRFVFRKL